MRWSSLRLRLIAGGAAAILVALTLAGIGLTVLFERHIARTIADDLDVHLKQLLAGIDVDPDGRLVVTRPPADPRFADPLSGLYWQIGDDRGQLLRSRSLWDTTLSLPVDEVVAGGVHNHEVTGPAGARVLIAERQVRLTINNQPVPVRVAVAVDLARVSAAGAAFARELAIALGLLGLVLAMATSVQVTLGLRPLEALRTGVADIRSGRSDRLPAAVPTEVLPLVEEVNALLDAQEREIERSRGRAADLAHGLKTPLAALAADAGRLRERGEAGNRARCRGGWRCDEPICRPRTRTRARSRWRSSWRRPVQRACTRSSVPSSRPCRVHLRARASRFDTDVPEHVTLPLDRTDLAEVLGNLLDNATRYAKSRVRIVAHASPGGMTVAVEDDGEESRTPRRCARARTRCPPGRAWRGGRPWARDRAGCPRGLRFDVAIARFTARWPQGRIRQEG